jgi:hypothetical protein
MYLDQLSNRLKIVQISIKNEKIHFKKNKTKKNKPKQSLNFDEFGV